MESYNTWLGQWVAVIHISVALLILVPALGKVGATSIFLKSSNSPRGGCSKLQGWEVGWGLLFPDAACWLPGEKGKLQSHWLGTNPVLQDESRLLTATRCFMEKVYCRKSDGVNWIMFQAYQGNRFKKSCCESFWKMKNYTTSPTVFYFGTFKEQDGLAEGPLCFARLWCWRLRMVDPSGAQRTGSHVLENWGKM